MPKHYGVITDKNGHEVEVSSDDEFVHVGACIFYEKGVGLRGPHLSIEQAELLRLHLKQAIKRARKKAH